jgi:hypothetical protein
VPNDHCHYARDTKGRLDGLWHCIVVCSFEVRWQSTCERVVVVRSAVLLRTDKALATRCHVSSLTRLLTPPPLHKESHMSLQMFRSKICAPTAQRHIRNRRSSTRFQFQAKYHLLSTAAAERLADLRKGARLHLQTICLESLPIYEVPIDQRGAVEFVSSYSVAGDRIFVPGE